MIKHSFITFYCLLIISFAGLSVKCNAQENSNQPPEIAIVLFDGSDFSKWDNCDGGEVGWKIIGNAMEIVPDTLYKCERIQGIKTRSNYRDFQLHLEFRIPEPDANSGIYIHKRYEVQISNTYKKPYDKYMGGSIYMQKLPDRNVARPVGEWQTYDIIFRSPRYKRNDFYYSKQEDARITVLQNGIVIHNNIIVQSPTGRGFPEDENPGPIMIQDHGSWVQFRNIWIIPGEDTVY